MVNTLWRSGQETFSPVLQTRGGQAERRAETGATRAGGSETGANLSCRDEQRSQQSGTYWCPVAGFLPMFVDPGSAPIRIQSDSELFGQVDPALFVNDLQDANKKIFIINLCYILIKGTVTLLSIDKRS